MFEKFLKQRGQVSILFALLMPIFLMVVGVGLDLGWYYLNVSRLQNAADAAAVAGAQTLINNENFSDYKSVTLTSKYPGKVSEQYRTAETAKIKAIDESNDVAKEYVAKNLSSRKDNIINSWTKSKVETETPTIYEKDDNLYFVVQLREEIRHFFLPGWFGEMDAPVTAVAMITKSAISDPSEPSAPEITSTPTAPTKPNAPASTNTPTTPQTPEEDPETITEEFADNLEAAKNANVIVGNWEVQKYYKDINNKNKKQTYLDIFGSEICVNGWNIFQDEYVHYTNGDLYRTEHIKFFDDVELNDYRKTGKERYTESNLKTNGTTGIGAYALRGSSVKKTNLSASANTLNVESYTYNEGGYPYVWQDLDSVDVDFKPEVSFNESSPYLSKDWDLPMGYANSNIACSDGSGRPSVGVGILKHKKALTNGEELGGWYTHLRIHSTITFGEPYRERTSSPPREDMNLPDILWMRIESEPMFRYPDSVDHYVKTNLDIKGLNSVRQIILNFTVSNYDIVTQKYRPVVIFYDGPEMYYPYSTSEDSRNKIRTSRPIIVNLNVPYRLILYAPNSPVVVMGTTDGLDGFQGFIVAKKYLRLKTAEDFKKEDEAYFNKHGEHKYEMPPDEKSYFQTNYAVDNPYYGTEHTTVDKNGNVIATIISDNGEPKEIRWLYTKIINPDNGIEMYVDDYGNVQYMELENPPMKIGKYETFGRTDFSSHGYHILGDSAINLILSGN